MITIRYGYIPRETTFIRYANDELETLILGHWHRVGEWYPLGNNFHLVPDLALLLVGAPAG